MTQIFEIIDNLEESVATPIEQKDEAEYLTSDQFSKLLNSTRISEDVVFDNEEEQHLMTVADEELGEFIGSTVVGEAIDETEKEILAIKDFSSENKSKSPNVEEICSDDYITRAAGEGYIPNEEEAKSIEEIELRLKSLLTNEEYNSLYDSPKATVFDDTQIQTNEICGKGDKRVLVSTLKEIDRQLDDLARLPSDTTLSEDEISILVNESSKQLNQLREEGQLIPVVNDDVINKLLSDAQESNKDTKSNLEEINNITEEIQSEEANDLLDKNDLKMGQKLKDEKEFKEETVISEEENFKIIEELKQDLEIKSTPQMEAELQEEKNSKTENNVTESEVNVENKPETINLSLIKNNINE